MPTGSIHDLSGPVSRVSPGSRTRIDSDSRWLGSPAAHAAHFRKVQHPTKLNPRD